MIQWEWKSNHFLRGALSLVPSLWIMGYHYLLFSFLYLVNLFDFTIFNHIPKKNKNQNNLIVHCTMALILHALNFIPNRIVLLYVALEKALYVHVSTSWKPNWVFGPSFLFLHNTHHDFPPPRPPLCHTCSHLVSEESMRALIALTSF